jgi:rhodanese-related sulfurtransferase
MTAPDITAAELKERLATGEQPFIVDVREPWEHEQSQLPTETRNIPLGSLPDHFEMITDYRDQEVIVHCRSGARSATAKAFLQQQGFQKVRNLLGGILAFQG